MVHLPALEKISLRAHSYALARLAHHLSMPNLRLAHIAPIVGYTGFDEKYIHDHVLPAISRYLLRGAQTFDRVLFDQACGKEFARVVATSGCRVLELSLQDYIKPHGPHNHF